MHRRLFLSLVMLLALLVAPFGRMAAAEAMAAPHHSSPPPRAALPRDMPAPDRAPEDRGAMTIDCLVACATIAAAEAPALAALEPLAVSPASRALTAFIGIHPEAEPPPPRHS
ncbi:MAG: hypothetical protein ACT4N8_12060 [Sphingosinicella sp.]|uniref:hypothetical protein n=1 Tax=Sphingosinicella sp. TaxID=1917971 RepID=UPI004037F462